MKEDSQDALFIAILVALIAVAPAMCVAKTEGYKVPPQEVE